MATTLETLNTLSSALENLKRIITESVLDLLSPQIPPYKRPPEPEERPLGSKECPTCHGGCTVEMHQTKFTGGKKTSTVFEEFCKDCNGNGYVSEYSKSVYEI